MTAKKECMNI